MARRKKIQTTPIDVTEFIVSHDLDYLTGMIIKNVLESNLEEAATDLQTAIKVGEQLRLDEKAAAKPPKTSKTSNAVPKDSDDTKPSNQAGWGA